MKDTLNQNRKQYIDFLRLLALLYMFFQHSVLILLKQNDNVGIIKIVFDIVPLCPALFLFVAGLSLTLPFENENYTYSKKSLFHSIKRGVELIIISSILFFIQFGFQLPDIFISSSILNSIGILIIVSALILIFKDRAYISLIFTFILICLFATLDIKEIGIKPLTIGYEPIFPTIIFGFVGLTVGLFFAELKKNQFIQKTYIITLCYVGLIILLFFIVKYGYLNVLKERHTVTNMFDSSLTLQNIFTKGSGVKSYFIETIWNYNIESFLASLGFVLAIYSIFFFLEPIFNKSRSLNKLLLPARYSLFNYIFHLLFIGTTTLIFGYNNLNTISLIAFLIILLFLSYALSYIIERGKKWKR